MHISLLLLLGWQFLRHWTEGAPTTSDDRCKISSGGHGNFSGVRVLSEMLVGGFNSSQRLAVVECALGRVLTEAIVTPTPPGSSLGLGLDFSKFICIEETQTCVKLARRRSDAWQVQYTAFHRPGSLLGGAFFCTMGSGTNRTAADAAVVSAQRSRSAHWTWPGTWGREVAARFASMRAKLGVGRKLGQSKDTPKKHTTTHSGPESYRAIVKDDIRTGLARHNITEICSASAPMPLLADNPARVGRRIVTDTNQVVVYIPLVRTADVHDRYYAISNSWATDIDIMERYGRTLL